MYIFVKESKNNTEIGMPCRVVKSGVWNNWRFSLNWIKMLHLQVNPT